MFRSEKQSVRINSLGLPKKALPKSVQKQKLPMRALVILHPEFEEIEAVTPMDLLSRANIRVKSASTTSELAVKGRSSITLIADCLLHDLGEETFDAIVLPGGPGIQKLRGNPFLCELLRNQYASGKWLACICAAPLLLMDAGLIQEGASYACHPSVEENLPGVSSGNTVAIDGTILTSRGAGTAAEFSLALIEQLSGQKTAESIAKSVCFNPVTLH